MEYTPQEVAKLLANRPHQPHYVKWLLEQCLRREMAAERERCAKAAHAAIHSVHPAMRQSADIMMNAVNKAIGYPIKP